MARPGSCVRPSSIPPPQKAQFRLHRGAQGMCIRPLWPWADAEKQGWLFRRSAETKASPSAALPPLAHSEREWRASRTIVAASPALAAARASRPPAHPDGQHRFSLMAVAASSILASAHASRPAVLQSPAHPDRQRRFSGATVPSALASAHVAHPAALQPPAHSEEQRRFVRSLTAASLPFSGGRFRRRRLPAPPRPWAGAPRRLRCSA